MENDKDVDEVNETGVVCVTDQDMENDEDVDEVNETMLGDIPSFVQTQFSSNHFNSTHSSLVSDSADHFDSPNSSFIVVSDSIDRFDSSNNYFSSSDDVIVVLPNDYIQDPPSSTLYNYRT